METSLDMIALGTFGFSKSMQDGKVEAQGSSRILMSGRQVVVASSLLHASGFFFGYLLKSLIVPCAVSSVCCSIFGSALDGIWNAV
ncbi:hypothetical protein D5086_003344 [Populus alba]|uniref:Uncharacterized protein n=2 Tax=Populus TaxID=3689 RepID=A0ACC4D5K4_POPAL